MTGPSTTTVRTKASHPDQFVVLGQVREDERRGKGLGAEGEVEDPRRLIRQDQADRHEGVRAPVGHARQRESE